MAHQFNISLLFSSIVTSSLACLIPVVILLLFLLVSRGAGMYDYAPAPAPPQPAGSLPILGHLHLLTGPDVIHRALAKLADVNGPIFTLNLGLRQQAIVVSNRELAKACMSTANIDIALSNRPNTLAFNILGCNRAMFMVAPYGPFWREMRKITKTKVLSNQNLSFLKQTLVSQWRESTSELLHNMYSRDKNKAQSSNTVEVDLSKWFKDLTYNIMLNLTAGGGEGLEGSVKEGDYKATFQVLFRLFGAVTVSDALPFMRWLDVGGYEKTMKRAAAELDGVTQRWLDDHRGATSGLNYQHRDLMDVLLDHFEADHNDFFGYQVDNVIKATTQMLILGGVDTTSWTLIWAVSLLLNHPDILNKAKKELTTHFGKDSVVNHSADLNHQNLPYISAIIKETMRLYPSLPLNPRESNSDVVIGGYHVPAGTRIYFNIHKIHRDPLVYPNPDEFRPERFLGVVENNIIPFGGGRRVCPGASYANQTMLFILSNFLHQFDITLPSKELVDMTEGHGTTNVKATPLQVLISPSLPPHLYEEKPQ